MQENFLVSGGSGGIGSAVCHALAASTYRPIVGFGKHSDVALQIAEQTGGIAVPLDLSSDISIDEAVETIAADPAPLAGLILAASPAPTIAPFGKIDADDVSLQWRVNVEGPRRLLAGLVRRCLRPRKFGIAVAVLTKAMGDCTQPAAQGMGAYVIAKYGLLGLMRVAAVEYPWLRTGVVHPGFTETAMLDAFDRRFLDAMRAREAGGKFANPQAVAVEITAKVEGLKTGYGI